MSGSKESSTSWLLKKDPSTGMGPMSFYGRCMGGGALACGITHASVVTLDVAKCRSQAHSQWPSGLVPSIRRTWVEEGMRGITKGWVPTFYGYSAQGLCKFGLNEVFKDYYTHLYGAENLDSTPKKMLLWALASGSAEIFADVALCPFEMTKVKMQVTLPGMKDGVSDSLLPAFRDMNARKAETKFPFGSLQPLWFRQVPYTMIKFVGFYQTQNMVYEEIFRRSGKRKEDFSAPSQLAITFGCGYFAGIFCAIVTQPADNLVSMKGSAENANKSFSELAKQMGTRDLFLRGLTTRILMIGTLTGLQWWIYGAWKNMFGLGTS
ncbi:Phosphate carrier protein, mitochondrial [Seminavis robusta]|uniref:Phosphate carrier protein, mitochondrial n=1 Tax=Seminavis robusta TaxID=568900 RepID=A0A9N8EDP9_9STRA|nr:Phosphate carrier protein, mitochondrial [Seminavis robusta]|eukprot:Sro846_g210140.1 Phosphate carrier protein, mitochondrial (322) ;mRNA; r:16342-17431